MFLIKCEIADVYEMCMYDPQKDIVVFEDTDSAIKTYAYSLEEGGNTVCIEVYDENEGDLIDYDQANSDAELMVLLEDIMYQYYKPENSSVKYDDFCLDDDDDYSCTVENEIDEVVIPLVDYIFGSDLPAKYTEIKEFILAALHNRYGIDILRPLDFHGRTLQFPYKDKEFNEKLREVFF